MFLELPKRLWWKSENLEQQKYFWNVIVVVECYCKEKVTKPNNYIFFSVFATFRFPVTVGLCRLSWWCLKHHHGSKLLLLFLSAKQNWLSVVDAFLAGVYRYPLYCQKCRNSCKHYRLIKIVGSFTCKYGRVSARDVEFCIANVKFSLSSVKVLLIMCEISLANFSLASF